MGLLGRPFIPPAAYHAAIEEHISMPIPAREVAHGLVELSPEARCRYLRTVLEFAELEVQRINQGPLTSYSVIVETTIQARSVGEVREKAVGFFSSPVTDAKVLMCEPVIDDTKKDGS